MSPFRCLRLAVLGLGLTQPLATQSLMYRSANLGGTWVVDPGVAQFNFLHRFYVGPPPSHFVVNYPTFTLSTGLGHDVALGVRFATRSIAGLLNVAPSSNAPEIVHWWRVYCTSCLPVSS